MKREMGGMKDEWIDGRKERIEKGCKEIQMKERGTEGRMDRMIHRRRCEQEETRKESNEIGRNDA